jgi:hypothetical protein
VWGGEGKKRGKAERGKGRGGGKNRRRRMKKGEMCGEIKGGNGNEVR